MVLYSFSVKEFLENIKQILCVTMSFFRIYSGPDPGPFKLHLGSPVCPKAVKGLRVAGVLFRHFLEMTAQSRWRSLGIHNKGNSTTFLQQNFTVGVYSPGGSGCICGFPEPGNHIHVHDYSSLL